MRTLATFAAVLVLLFVGANTAAALDYGWSVSLSSTDPDVNTGAAGAPFSTTTFYLWINCFAGADGAAAAGMTAVVTGGAFAGGFNNEPFVLNAGDGSNLQLAIGGCPQGPTLIGNWGHLNTDGTGIKVCLTGDNLTVDCDQITPTEFPHATTGCSTLQSDLTTCPIDSCVPVSVSPDTWGGVKALYR
ncbi:hypothetical protein K8I85_07265 [bacterium]|nr:hypothetical protein [bacterium]